MKNEKHTSLKKGGSKREILSAFHGMLSMLCMLCICVTMEGAKDTNGRVQNSHLHGGGGAVPSKLTEKHFPGAR